MRHRTLLILATSVAAMTAPGVVRAQEAPQATNATTGTPSDPNLKIQEGEPTVGNDIVVTARQRQERLQDVPIAVTAISGDAIKQQQLVLIKDVAAYSPGLNINSDSAGRAFISIRGVGTTLIDSVQPGVGLFIDGVYQPNTSYLNSPLVDVERVEVLRGPQGTLFGNNTLGGAINVITRQPTNEWHVRLDGSLAGGDNFASASGSISGPIIKDVLQFRVGAAYHTQDGFERNALAGGNQNPLETKSVNGTLRFTPTPWATFTLNANYDRVFGGSVPYFTSTGPTDYSLNGQTNSLSLVTIDYYGVNLKGEFQVDPIKTKITAIGAYNESDATSFADGDFSPIDFLRATQDRTLKTYTGELRFDTQWSDKFSTLIGGFVSHYTTFAFGTSTIVPLALTIPTTATSTDNNQAIFGTAFLKLGETIDIAAGLRYDHQKLNASTAGLPAAYEANNFEPRVTLTKHWSHDFMTYASVARGVRGGGQNGPGAPNLTYKGDSVWTYEVGTKLTALDNKLTADADVFYNDYSDYIGPNALAPSTIVSPTTGQPVGFVAINLNTGKVKSYGLEAEVSYAITPDWRVYGNATALHARVTDSSEFQGTTGYAYPGNRIPFVPDFNYTVGSNFRVPLPHGQAIVLDANVIGKGRRAASTLDATSLPFLDGYTLVNASLVWQTPHFDVGVFATNLTDAKYIESYIDKSALARAGVPAFLVNNLVIQGNRQRIGLRGTIRF
ncbi:TonB-dependent receptor [Sphingomonas sp. GC_Shp_2]|uniref:TonB-dependent receptor n=2 Tax=unclassified Sphingomonas TaxID=196159 RepID=UPI00226A5B0C|nr:TonB-dependent receptor [Sphingomonas sp. GC_Shp_2]